MADTISLHCKPFLICPQSIIYSLLNSSWSKPQPYQQKVSQSGQYLRRISTIIFCYYYLGIFWPAYSIAWKLTYFLGAWPRCNSQHKIGFSKVIYFIHSFNQLFSESPLFTLPVPVTIKYDAISAAS